MSLSLSLRDFVSQSLAGDVVVLVRDRLHAGPLVELRVVPDRRTPRASRCASRVPRRACPVRSAGKFETKARQSFGIGPTTASDSHLREGVRVVLQDGEAQVLAAPADRIADERVVAPIPDHQLRIVAPVPLDPLVPQTLRGEGRGAEGGAEVSLSLQESDHRGRVPAGLDDARRLGTTPASSSATFGYLYPEADPRSL